MEEKKRPELPYLLYPQYHICRTCGRYISLNENPQFIENEGYCSEECKQVYLTCVICGKYFTFDQSYEQVYCSPECATKHTYLGKLGPKPNIIHSEKFYYF